MSSSQPENQLDNDKEELRLKLLAEINDYSDPSNNEAGHHNPVYSSKELLKIVDQYTQSKLKAFAGDVEALLEYEDVERWSDPVDRQVAEECNQLKSNILKAIKAIKEKAGIE